MTLIQSVKRAPAASRTAAQWMALGGMAETQGWFIAFGYRLFVADKSAVVPST